MPRRPPDLDILVITWNGRDRLPRCLDSIRRHALHRAGHVVVVDNGSVDGTLEMVRQGYPWVTLLGNPSNLGTTRARNQGLGCTRAAFVLCLDDDTELRPGALERLRAMMDRHPRAGLVGAQLLAPDFTIQPSCRRFPHVGASVLNRLRFLPGVARNPSLRHYLMADFDHADSRPVECCIGACQLLRTAALTDVGRFDEGIFYGAEDLDLCVRMWLGGWEVWYAADAPVIHLTQRRTRRRVISRLSWRHLRDLAFLFAKYRVEDRRLLARAVAGACARSAR